jgi:hypothetical protein
MTGIKKGWRDHRQPFHKSLSFRDKDLAYTRRRRQAKNEPADISPKIAIELGSGTTAAPTVEFWVIVNVAMFPTTRDAAAVKKLWGPTFTVALPLMERFNSAAASLMDTNP